MEKEDGVTRLRAENAAWEEKNPILALPPWEDQENCRLPGARRAASHPASASRQDSQQLHKLAPQTCSEWVQSGVAPTA